MKGYKKITFCFEVDSRTNLTAFLIYKIVGGSDKLVFNITKQKIKVPGGKGWRLMNQNRTERIFVARVKSYEFNFWELDDLESIKEFAEEPLNEEKEWKIKEVVEDIWKFVKEEIHDIFIFEKIGEDEKFFEVPRSFILETINPFKSTSFKEILL